MSTLILTRDLEQALMGSDLGLQSSQHHRSKALDEIYKTNTGSRWEQGAEDTSAADNVVKTICFRCFQDVDSS